MTKTHELKTDPEVFQALSIGAKTFEIRKDDRGFEVGDTLTLRETVSPGCLMAHGARLEYTGRQEQRKVTHVLRGPMYGLSEGWVILSVEDPRIAELEAQVEQHKAAEEMQIALREKAVERETALSETLEELKQIFGIGEGVTSTGVVLTNARNCSRFADLLHAIEMEFFMVPGEPDEDYPNDEPPQECLMNCWGSSKEEYIEQFRKALAWRDKGVAAACLRALIRHAEKQAFWATLPDNKGGEPLIPLSILVNEEAALRQLAEGGTCSQPKRDPHADCELECGAYGTYCKCKDKGGA